MGYVKGYFFGIVGHGSVSLRCFRQALRPLSQHSREHMQLSVGHTPSSVPDQVMQSHNPRSATWPLSAEEGGAMSAVSYQGPINPEL